MNKVVDFELAGDSRQCLSTGQTKNVFFLCKQMKKVSRQKRRQKHRLKSSVLVFRRAGFSGFAGE
jgi:hypothetical protein